MKEFKPVYSRIDAIKIELDENKDMKIKDYNFDEILSMISEMYDALTECREMDISEEMHKIINDGLCRANCMCKVVPRKP